MNENQKALGVIRMIFLDFLKIDVPRSEGPPLRYSYPEDRIFNRVISDISVVQRETTLTTSDSIEASSPVKSEIVRVVSFNTMEITEITRFIKQFSWSIYLKKHFF